MFLFHSERQQLRGETVKAHREEYEGEKAEKKKGKKYPTFFAPPPTFESLTNRWFVRWLVVRQQNLGKNNHNHSNYLTFQPLSPFEEQIHGLRRELRFWCKAEIIDTLRGRRVLFMYTTSTRILY